ncbi:MAG: YbaN family protein [Pseudomonadota bacterium]
MMKMMRAVWLLIGVTALGLGALGVVLPLLPTTPFILLAAYAFARSSDRLHRWLHTHPAFGPLIKNWRTHGAIDRRTKTVGTVSMAGVFALSVVLNVAPVVLAVQGVVLTVCAVFVLSRPSPPQA